MISRWKRSLVGLVVVAFLLSSLVFVSGSAVGTDKTDVLTDFVAKVTQNGVEITEGGSLTSTAPINVEISFGVPVIGDEPTPNNPVYQYDTATFELSSAFTLVAGATISLNMGTIVVGHVTFTETATGIVIANVLFDGDASVFDGTYNTVTCRFNADFEYDDTGDAGSWGEHVITILNKTYTVIVPTPDIIYTMTKSGALNMADKTIEWTVDVTATQGGNSISLEGYQLTDTLSTIGEYVAGSFTVGGNAATPAYANGVLSYTFPAGTVSPKTIKFKTAVSDTNYYATTQQSLTNTAKLLNSESTQVSQAQYTVKFTPLWIVKAGATNDTGSSGVYDPTGRTITWTITANQYGASLNNVVISDVLPTGLDFVSAQWQTWNGTGWNTATGITPNSIGEYALGNINTQILLTIVSSVPDADYTTGVSTYTNSAKIRWDGLGGDGLGSNSISIGIGYNAITKTGTAQPATKSVLWTVHVNEKNQTIPDLKVYDLLVYASSGFNASQVDAGSYPSGLNLSDLTPRYNQQYIDSSFTDTAGTGLSIAVYPLYKSGVRIADLLEITGFALDKDNVFTFRSLVVNPDIFAGNKSSTLYNTATLFSATTKLNQATKSLSYVSRDLSKQMLNRTAVSDPAAGVNSAVTTNTSYGYDYVDESVIFRLSINSDGIDLTGAINASGNALGAATVTDTLPAGWEFVDITDGVQYLIFEATANTTGTLLASDTTPDVVADLTANISGQTAAFTFQTLNRPYVILVKARPTSETVADYFSENQTTTVTNTLNLKAENWTPGVNSTQAVKITSVLLEKTLEVPQTGVLKWTVNYQPYQVEQPGTAVQDTLPVGLDLYTDSTGALLIDGYISVYEMNLAADGSYSLGSQVTLIQGDNVSYDPSTRVLSFVIPDNTKGYRFAYLTVVTGEPGTVTNHVVLLGSNMEQESSSVPYIITKADGEASLQLNGWISVLKTDQSGSPLAGAQFTLYAADGVSIVRVGTTGSDGKLKFKVLPDGNYYLVETAAPAGYAVENITHTVSVSTSGGVVTSSIDGKTGSGSNTLTVKDFLENTAGSLTITKTVAGTAYDTTKSFSFTVTFTPATSGTYTYVGQGGAAGGTLQSGDTVLLSHGQSITIVGIPAGTTYTVTEVDDGSGYSAVTENAAGNIVADTSVTAAFTNTRNLPIVFEGVKTLSGVRPDALAEGEFSFSLYEASVTGTDWVQGTQIGTSVSNLADATFAFPEITYTEAGDYDYLLMENTPSNVAGVTDDTHIYQIHVVVAGNEDNDLLHFTSVLVDGAEKLSGNPAAFSFSFDFDNTYTPASTVLTFTGTKTLSGVRPDALCESEFSFSLYATDSAWTAPGTLMQTVLNTLDGSGGYSAIEFTEITYTAAGDYYYLLQEDTPSHVGGVADDTHVYKIHVLVTDDGVGQLHVASVLVDGLEKVTGDPAAFSFSFDFDNDYTPASAAITFDGSKTLSGVRPTALAAGEFSFSLYSASYTASGWVQGTQIGASVSNLADGTFGFPEISYTVAGEYDYALMENTPSGVGGVADDTGIYHIRVTVTDDNIGHLEISSVLVYDGEGDPDEEQAVTGTTGSYAFDYSFDFDNTYTPASTEITFAGIKTLSGVRPDALAADEFSFILYAATYADLGWVQGAQIGTSVSNAANGSFSFPTLTYTTAGDYYYLLTEGTPSNVGGVTDDTHIYQIHVLVTDDTIGNLHVTSVLVDGVEKVTGNPAAFSCSFDFDNEYTPASTAITFTGVKTLSGVRPVALSANEFSFSLYTAANGSPDWVQGTQIGASVGNAANGGFAFPTITYTAAGDYYYMLTEDTPSNVGGVTDDTQVYQIHVHVTDDSKGYLHVSSVLVNGTETVTGDPAQFSCSFDFDNTYTPAPTAVTFEGVKTLSGVRPAALGADEFSFSLYATDRNWTAPGTLVETVLNADDGNGGYTAIAFSEISYDTAGDYYYLLMEDTPSNVGGVADDTHAYQIHVLVTDDSIGYLHVESVLVDGEEKVTGDPAAFSFSFDFENIYTPAPTSITFEGAKTLQGRPKSLRAGEFTFKLYMTDSSWTTPGTLMETVGNLSDGLGGNSLIAFSEITYTAAGDYYYLLMENTPTGLGGVTDDKHVYKIHVLVTDDSVGYLHVESVLVDGAEKVKGDPAAFIYSFNFNNTYKADPISVPFSASKEFISGTLQAGDYAFVLKDAAGNIIDYVKNMADGSIIFSDQVFRNAGVYLYTVEEVIGNDPNIAYDTTVFTFRVSITDLSNGQFSAHVTILKNGTKVDEAVFRNSYKMPETGDSTHRNIWIAMILGSALLMSVLIAVRFRKSGKSVSAR